MCVRMTIISYQTNGRSILISVNITRQRPFNNQFITNRDTRIYVFPLLVSLTHQRLFTNQFITNRTTRICVSLLLVFLTSQRPFTNQFITNRGTRIYVFSLLVSLTKGTGNMTVIFIKTDGWVCFVQQSLVFTYRISGINFLSLYNNSFTYMSYLQNFHLS